MKVLLTGAAGRVGSSVCRHLHQAGIELLATDLVPHRDLPVKIRLANLLDPLECRRLVEGMEAIVHLGNHPWSWSGRHQQIFQENVAMNTHLFSAARDAGVRRVIFASSINVICGPNHDLDLQTHPLALPLSGQTPANPGNPYGMSKYASERLLQFLTCSGAMSGIALRFPALVAEADLPQRRQRLQDTLTQRRGFYLERLFYLSHADVGGVIQAALRAPLTGYRCFFPSLLLMDLAPPVQARIRHAWPRQTSAVDLSRGYTALIDPVPLERDLGWTPRRA